jgi:glycosyltransferase involved in cell wall biosynthesis
MTPLVSIVIPCFNKRAYVAAAIESALSQGKLAEVIVIDDGSTDGSLEEVRRFDSQIIWETGSNRGGSAARNRGLALASGKHIQFLDADDLLPEGKLAAQLAVLESAGSSAMAFCPWSFFHDDGRIEPPDPRHYWHDFDSGFDLLLEMWTYGGFFPPHAWLTHRALIDEVGTWDESLTGDDDGEFFARLLIQAGQIHFTAFTQVLYRDPPEGSVSRNTSIGSARSFWAAFDQIANRILAQRSDRKAKRAVLSRLRTTAYAWRNLPEIVDRAAALEGQFGVVDFSPSLPAGSRWLIGLLGIKLGLEARRLMKA